MHEGRGCSGRQNVCAGPTGGQRSIGLANGSVVRDTLMAGGGADAHIRGIARFVARRLRTMVRGDLRVVARSRIDRRVTQLGADRPQNRKPGQDEQHDRPDAPLLPAAHGWSLSQVPAVIPRRAGIR